MNNIFTHYAIINRLHEVCFYPTLFLAEVIFIVIESLKTSCDSEEAIKDFFSS